MAIDTTKVAFAALLHNGISFPEVYRVVMESFQFPLIGLIGLRFHREESMTEPIHFCVGTIALQNYQGKVEVQIQKPLVIGCMQSIQVTKGVFCPLIALSHL